MSGQARSDGAALGATTTVWLVAALLMLQPLSTDLYLPTLPSIATEFDAAVATVQWTLSLFIASFAVAQLIAGPLSDRYGRYPVVLGGVSLYLVASLLCAFAPSIEVLIGARVLQALGACACVVTVRAIVRDLHEPAEGARLLAAAGTIMGLAPAIGPILGGLLTAYISWRAAFGLLATLGTVILIFMLLRLRETNRYRNPRALAPRVLVSNYLAVLRSPTFLAYTLGNTASYAGLFAFISGSSFVLIRVYGLSTAEYGFAFAASVAGYIPGTLICRRLMRGGDLRHTLQLGATLQVCAGVGVAVLALAGVHHVLAVVLPMFVYVIGHGIVQPTAQAGAVARFPQMAGAAAAVMGLIIQLTAAAVGMTIGATWNGTPYPMTLTVGCFGVASLAVALALVRRHGHVGP